MATNPIQYGEIAAWAQLGRIDIGPCEVMAIRRLDTESRKSPEEEPGSIGKAMAVIKEQEAAAKSGNNNGR